MMKNKVLISLLIIVSTILASCNSPQSPYPYEYPEDYTAETCFEQYELFDPNIAYTECYDFVSKKHSGGVNFSAIKDCEDLSFMVFNKNVSLLGTSHYINVVRNKGSTTNPTTDFTPSKAELIWYKNEGSYSSCMAIDFDPREEKGAEGYHKYGTQFLSETVVSIDSAEAIDEIMNVAAKDTVLSYYLFVLEQRRTEIYDSKLKGIYSEKGSLYVKVSFEECEGLVFIGKVLLDEDNLSYMEHIVFHRKDSIKLSKTFYNGSTGRFRYRLGESMDAFVQQAIESIE